MISCPFPGDLPDESHALVTDRAAGRENLHLRHALHLLLQSLAARYTLHSSGRCTTHVSGGGSVPARSRPTANRPAPRAFAAAPTGWRGKWQATM